MELTRKHHPAAVYYPSIGMSVFSLVLINLRLAPVQCMALGHPATTHSNKIDYVLVEEDYIGEPGLFSEKLVALPKNAIPYLEPKLDHPVPTEKKKGGPVRVAVPAALMKLNPRFLLTCRAVQERSSVDVEFHIMAGGDYGFVHDYLEKSVLNLLPGARVHRTVPYPKYMVSIAACDVFANPFPFGNTNGIVDTVFCGLPGVCLSGGEVHSHIDEGMFRRMNFPEWTIARTPEDYISALLRLIEDDGLRNDLSSRILNERWDRVLYEGRPEAFAEVFCRLVDAGAVPAEQASRE
jgi:glycosyltransferase involved in cell wall biosynthesis